MMLYPKRIILIMYLFMVSLTGFSQVLHDNQHNDIKFIRNMGQWDHNVLYRALIPDGFLFLENKGLTYLFYDGEAYGHLKHNFDSEGVLDYHVIKVEFIGANVPSAIIPSQQTTEYYNFFLGNNKSKWASGVSGYFDVNYEGIYPGINAELSGIESQLEYSFFLKPHADPKQIRLKYIGTENIYVQQGDLHVVSSINTFVEFKPEAYSVVDGNKRAVECSFKLNGNVLSYDFPQGYDPQYPLVIDPVVIFSTFSGSYADNFGYTATYDDSGYAYSGGTVFDMGFPTTPGAFQDTFAGGGIGQPGTGNGRDIGILKYTPDGKKLVYCTYIGGSGNEDPHSMIVNSKYELVIFGNVNSKDFPIGQHFWDSSENGSYDIYVAKLSMDGKQLIASTYVGGNAEDAINSGSTLFWNYGDLFRGEVIVDSHDNVYVVTTTKSGNFPVTAGAFKSSIGGSQDACIIKLSTDLDNLLNSSYIGGSKEDAGYGITLDTYEDIYICGGTKSNNLPVQSGKYQTSFQGGESDGFIYKISADFSGILTSTYLGTLKYDQTYFIQTDKSNNVYVTGQTKSDIFPVKNVKYSKLKGKQFFVKFKPSLDSIIFSSVFGSGDTTPNLSPTAFLVDNCERVYFSGWGGVVNDYNYNGGRTFNLPVTPDAFQKTTDGSDFYLAVFAKNFEALLYGSYFGGKTSHEHVDGGTSRFDKKGVVYQSVCAGCGSNSDFPTYPNPGVWSNTNNSWNCNNALFKLDLLIPDLKADFSVKNMKCLKETTTITNTSIGGLTYFWDFGDGDTSTEFEPKHHYHDTGTYKIKLIVRNIFSCSTVDSITKLVAVYNDTISDFVFDTSECVNFIKFKVTTKGGNSFKWSFGDQSFSTQKNPDHIYKRDTATYKVILYVDSGSVCENQVTKKINVKDFPVAGFTYTVDTCRGRLTFTNISVNSKNWLWYFGDAKSSNQKNPVHDYLSAGTFGIIFYTEPGTVCADSAIISVQIKVPKANAVVAIDTCNFKAFLVNPSRYLFDKSIWYFGDGDSLYYLDSVLHTYPGPGIYNIRLIANTGTICEDTVNRIIELPELPKADFNYTNQGCSPYVFIKNLSDHAVKSDWDFGKGFNTNNADSFFHKFDSSGTYITTLITYSQASCSDTISDTIQIDHLALADFNFDMDTCSTEVRFKNLSTKTGTYLWDFGDTYKSSITSPLHKYDTSGKYIVTLIVNDNPCIDTIIKPINIYDKLPFAIDCRFDTCSTKIRLKPSTNSAFNYFWQLGDGKSSTQKNLEYIYASSGTYTISLTINRDTVCTDSVTKEITIFKYRFDDIIIPNIITPDNNGLNDTFTIKNLNIHCDVYKLLIYNRWGELIYESLPNKIFWDGRVEKGIVSPGTYYFILQGTGFERVGTITVAY
jgi:gliding motility-associated-like protein